MEKPFRFVEHKTGEWSKKKKKKRKKDRKEKRSRSFTSFLRMRVSNGSRKRENDFFTSLGKFWKDLARKSLMFKAFDLN